MTSVPHHSKLMILSAKVGLTLAALWFVFRGVDVSHLGDMLQRQDRAMLAIAAALIACQIALGAFRWRLILEAIGVPSLPWNEALRIYYISIFLRVKLLIYVSVC